LLLKEGAIKDKRDSDGYSPRNYIPEAMMSEIMRQLLES
jgi:hypothetical protein